MNRTLSIAFIVLVGLGVAYAEDKVAKDSGTARVRFEWEKLEGGVQGELARIGRTVEGPGVGAVEPDSSSTAVFVSYDPEKTTASAIYTKLKDTRSYEAAKLSSVVACFKGPFAVVTASAYVKGAKGSAKRKGELVVQVQGAGGLSVTIDAKGGKPHGKFKPGVQIKAPHEVDMDKGQGKVDHAGPIETYAHGLSIKKGGEDSVITVTVNLIAKGADGKEQLHAIELPVPVQSAN